MGTLIHVNRRLQRVNLHAVLTLTMFLWEHFAKKLIIWWSLSPAVAVILVTVYEV